MPKRNWQQLIEHLQFTTRATRKKLEATLMVDHFTDIQERSLLVLIFSFAGITQFKFRDISQALITEVIVATPVEDRIREG